MKRIYPKSEACIGCHICEVACITAHSKSQDAIIAYTKERAGGLDSCRSVFEKGSTCVALSCRHCDNPMCVAACISGALSKDPETGRTVYDKEKCVACWSCVMACPFGAIRRNPVENIIIKCDLCEGREQPACVQACPNAALVYEDRTP